MTNSGFLAAARCVQTGLSNELFSAVQPTPAEVVPHILEMQSLLIQTNLGNNMLRGKRDEVRATITEMLYRQSLSVNFLANGDMNMLVRSGFDISKEPERMPEPTKGVGLNVLRQADQIIWLTCDGIEYQDMYELEVFGAGDFRKSYISKRKRFKVEDLPADVVLNAQMRGINSRGPGQWTNSIPFMVYGNIEDKMNPKRISDKSFNYGLHVVNDDHPLVNDSSETS